MSKSTSKIINMIETRMGDTIEYFTIDGIFVGGFYEGEQVSPTTQPVVPKPKPEPKSGVLKNPTPADVRTQRAMESEEEETLDNKLAKKKDRA